MSARTKARKRAMDMLFASDVRREDLASILAEEGRRAEKEPARAESWKYAREIVLGVIEHRAEIDDELASTARGWTIERMPAVDRAILRVAIWELRHNPDVPAAVVIDEAVDAAKEYSTDDSGRFVHGVLGRLADR